MGSKKKSLSFFVAAVGCAASFLAACSTPAPVAQISPAEQRRHDHALGLRLAEEFEKGVQIRTAPAVSRYLDGLAQTLSAQDSRLGDSSARVFLIRDEGGVWRNFALPGNRIYLSLGLVKTLEFENELAAALAFQLAHLAERTLLKQAENRWTSGELRELFLFSEDSDRKAAQEAVGILYRAGFDPRGLSALWARLGRFQARSPYDAPPLSSLLQTTRQAIAANAPLRNPVVRSRAFLEAEKRIREL